MSGQLRAFLAAMRDRGYRDLRWALDWLDGLDWSRRGELAALIHPDDEEAQDAIDLKDFKDEADRVQERYGLDMPLDELLERE